MRAHCWRRAVPLVAGLLGLAGGGGGLAARPQAPYTVAYASFGPGNTDLFVADADGRNPRPLSPHAEADRNASFSADGAWIVFTSHRGGSADLYRVRPDGGDPERLTDDPALDDQAAFSPDGRHLVFVSNRGGRANLWVLEIATRTARRLTDHGDGDFRPAWSPDGRWIAFSSDRDSPKARGRGGFTTLHAAELYLIRPDGTGLRRLTRSESFAGSPAWSPDGATLAYYEATPREVDVITAPSRERGTTQIVTLAVATGERGTPTAGPGEKWSPRWVAADRIGYVGGGPEGGLDFTAGEPGARGPFGSPSWSPDGRRVVFHRDVDPAWPPFRPSPGTDPDFRLIRTGIFVHPAPGGDRLVSNDRTAAILHNTILVMDADGTRRSVLFGDPEKSCVAPAWSPRGDRIAFGFGRFFQSVKGPAIADIAVIRADGTGLRVLTDGLGNRGFPSWSPDGRHLVCRSSDGKTGGLAILDAETGAARELPTGSIRDNFPAWSPTGEAIAFTTLRDGDYEIATIRPDGTGLRVLTRTPGNDAHCSWSPDGRWIAFTSARGGFNDESALHPYNPQPYGHIYAMRADGSDVRRLTDDPFEHGTPSFLAPAPPR